MKTLYHVSNPINRQKILLNGLIPQEGDSYLAHYDNKPVFGKVVFVCTTNTYDTTYDDDRYEISLPDEEFNKLNFKPDNDVENGLYTSNVIKPKYLKLIYKGTGNDNI